MSDVSRYIAILLKMLNKNGRQFDRVESACINFYFLYLKKFWKVTQFSTKKKKNNQLYVLTNSQGVILVPLEFIMKPTVIPSFQNSLCYEATITASLSFQNEHKPIFVKNMEP